MRENAFSAGKGLKRGTARSPAAFDLFEVEPEKRASQRRTVKPARRAATARTGSSSARPHISAATGRVAPKRTAAAPKTRAASPKRGTTASGAKSGSATFRHSTGSRPQTDAARKLLQKLSFPGRKAKKDRKELPKGLSIALTVVLCAAICALIGLHVRHRIEHRAFEKMRAVVERDTFYAGTQVDGIDVSGMSLGQAQEYWTNTIEPSYANRTVMVEGMDEHKITAADLGYTSDYMEVLAAAWDAGRSGSLVERYKDITERTVTPVSYTVTRTLYDDEIIDRYVQAAARVMNQEAMEPGIASFDTTNYKFSFFEGKSGQKLDEERMAADMRATLENGGGTIALALDEVFPQSTVEDIEGDYGLIASARTNASSSSKARLSNLRTALRTLNGVSVKPGQTFSFNETVGQRTTKRGYKPAAAYSAGEVVEEVGGGICQVSTTLFNAVVKSNLQITERHNHSMPVGYVDKGKDATVDWGRLDFKFTNNTDTEIYIGAYLNSDKRVIIGIFGKKLPDGAYITVESVTTETEDYETVYEINEELLPGTENVKQEGRTGYKAEAYKLIWDKDGRQVSRTLLCKSHYFPREEIIEIPPP